MKHRCSLIGLVLVAATLSGCAAETPKVDYRIRVIPTADGAIAVPPECPEWSGVEDSPFDNKPWLQFGCASARNLAGMVENPEDLLDGRALGDGDGLTGAAAVERYHTGKTKNLLDPQAQSSSSAGN